MGGAQGVASPPWEGLGGRGWPGMAEPQNRRALSPGMGQGEVASWTAVRGSRQGAGRLPGAPAADPGAAGGPSAPSPAACRS